MGPTVNVVYQGHHTGRLPRINQKFGARSMGGKAALFMANKYRDGLHDMAMVFSVTRPTVPIDYPVDAHIEVSLWSRIDSDATIKGIFDALEIGRVLEDDKLVRHFEVVRSYHHRDTPDSVSVTLRETEKEV